MASTQKKTSAAKSGGKTSASAKSKTGGKKSGAKTQTQTKTQPEPQRRPIRREVGGLGCLLLAVFGFISYFDMTGWFIDWFRTLISGLFGYGFYLMPPVLLLASYILLFHRGRPVRFRLFCALMLPLLLGSIVHLLICRESFAWSWAIFAELWKSGVTCTSGGAISGVIAVALHDSITTVGALFVVILLTAFALLFALNRSVADVCNFFVMKAENRPRYEPEPEREKPVAHKSVKEPAHISPIDIPVDDNSAIRKEPTKPVTTVRKKKLFDKVSSVTTPDQVLTGETAPILEEEKPEFEDVPELEPISDSSFGGAAAPHPVEEKPAEEEIPEAPPVIREPAVEKVTKKDADAAHAQVAKEIEEGMSQQTQMYRYPPLSLLNEGRAASGAAADELSANRQRLQDTLQSFGVDAHIVNVTRGPSVTLYELELEQGVKLSKITSLSDDIALALGASAVRVAPIPDKIATVGIEVPNRQVGSVALRDVINSKAFTDSKSKVSFAVGKNIGGHCIVGDISKFPHLLIAGTTGSGKSVCTNSLIISLLYKATPEEVRLIMVDPKMVELGVYNGIPHLLIPVVTDPKKAAGALQWAVNEMMKRYRTFSEVGAKDLASYNNYARKSDKETMPQIVVVIDELADLMTVAAKEVEESICRIAQMGRASGIHLVIATQRPSADVITGLMKSNIPSRIAFAVKEAINSRIILDTTGAEKLVGKGDMLYSPVGADKPMRVQGCFVSEEEVAAVVEFIKEGTSARYDEEVMHQIEKHAEDKDKGKGAPAEQNPEGDYDELLPAAIDVVLEMGQASVSMLQRRLKLGYGRAARLVDQMEEKGVVGPFEGSKPRQLLITKEQWAEMQYRQDMVAAVPEEFPYEGDAVEQGRDYAPFDE